MPTQSRSRASGRRKYATKYLGAMVFGASALLSAFLSFSDPTGTLPTIATVSALVVGWPVLRIGSRRAASWRVFFVSLGCAIATAFLVVVATSLLDAAHWRLAGDSMVLEGAASMFFLYGSAWLAGGATGTIVFRKLAGRESV